VGRSVVYDVFPSRCPGVLVVLCVFIRWVVNYAVRVSVSCFLPVFGFLVSLGIWRVCVGQIVGL